MSKEKVELGKLLFFDPILSGNYAMPCAVCHFPEAGWSVPEPVSTGYPGTIHWRNSQTIINAAYYGKLFWAGASRSLESQARSAARGAVAGNGEDEHCRLGETRAELPACKRPQPFTRMMTVPLNVGQVVENIDTARNQAEAHKRPKRGQRKRQFQQLAVEDQPYQDETILSPLFGPHGPQQVQ